jgi:hypothetical protein
LQSPSHPGVSRPKHLNARQNPGYRFESFDWPENDTGESGRSRIMALAGPLAVLVFLDIALGLAFLVRESTDEGGIAEWLQRSQLPGPELIATVVVVACLGLFISIVVHVAVTSRAPAPDGKKASQRAVAARSRPTRRNTYW